MISDTKEAIAQMVQFWNDHAFDVAAYLPHIRPLMGNDPHNQFFGRHLVYKLIDGGSNQCPDKTHAAAIQPGNEDHAFAAYNDFDPLDWSSLHLQNLVIARMGDRTGVGVLEQAHFGPHTPSGLTGFVDGFRS